MVSTTYELLDDGTTENENTYRLTQIESITGNRYAYGYSTPINLTDIINQVGTVTGLDCLPYAVEDVNLITQILGVVLCEQYVFIWNSIRPDDSRVPTLLGWMDIILSGENVAGTPRVDYCGRDLTGPALIPDNQILDELTLVETDVDALSLVGSNTLYTLVIQNNGPLTDEQLASFTDSRLVSIDRDNPYIDPAQSTATSLPGYVPKTIAEAMAQDSYINDAVAYSGANGSHFYTITYRPTQGSTVPNFANLAVQRYFDAVKLAVNQVRFSTAFSLGDIYTQLRSAKAYYNNWQQQNLQPSLTQAGQAYLGRVPSTQAIKEAGINARVNALRDFAFVSSFDVDADGILSAAERLAMENSLFSVMVPAREAVATSIIAALRTQFDAFSSNVDDLTPTIVAYLT
jgi:hypothetical protein